MPIVKCVSCKSSYRIKDGQTAKVACPYCRTPYSSNQANIATNSLNPPGWLIVHDEQTYHQIFELQEGINAIGRKAETSKANIQIDFGNRPIDKLMSRVHCEIKVLPKVNGNGFDFLLKDLSSNGTVINARKDQKLFKDIDEIYLKHEDVIQMGRTKLVVIFGTRVESIEKTAEDIARTSYCETVINFNQ